jgi:hypothetical protein
MYIGDVGASRYEEVNFIPGDSGGGQNFGWRALEGPFDSPTFPDPAPPNAVDPIWYYDHSTGGAAVMGGYVYRGSEIPGFQGHYITVDQVNDVFTSFKYDGTTLTELTDRTEQLVNPISPTYNAVTSFGEDANGEIYFFDRVRGDVFKIVAAPLEGDFDNDGDVDGRDFLVWQRGGSPIPFSASDLAAWQSEYGLGGLAAVSAVPEPSSCFLILMGGVACLLLRK